MLVKNIIAILIIEMMIVIKPRTISLFKNLSFNKSLLDAFKDKLLDVILTLEITVYKIAKPIPNKAPIVCAIVEKRYKAGV